MPDYFVWLNVHVGSYGTPCRAFVALITGGNLLARTSLYLIKKIEVIHNTPALCTFECACNSSVLSRRCDPELRGTTFVVTAGRTYYTTGIDANAKMNIQRICVDIS